MTTQGRRSKTDRAPGNGARRLAPPSALHWNDLDDAAFLADFADAESAALRRACELRTTDPVTARRLVLDYFRSRSAPRWLFDFRRQRAARFTTRNYFWDVIIPEHEARETLRFRIRDPNCRTGRHDVGPEIDWRRAGVHQYGSSGWLVAHFWYWGLFAAAGFALTRDPAYARVFERFWRRWQEDFPFHVDPESAARGGAFSPDHSVMRAGRRLLVLTDVVYSGLFDALSDEVAFEVLNYLWFVSAQYLRLPRADTGRFRYHWGNHNLFDTGVTPYCIGTMWPEFRHSAELVRLGRASVRRHVRSSIDEEGMSVEHSSRYAWYIGNMYVQALEVARANGDALLLPGQERKLRRFLWRLVELTAPDGGLIPFGDGQPPPNHVQFHTYRALFADRAVRERAAAWGVDLERGDAPCAAPCEDAPPGRLRRRGGWLRRSGMLLVRDGVGPESSMLWIVADPRSETGHGHFDFTSFQLWTRGVPLVLDTPGFGYRIEEIVPEERAFYYSPFGHSLLTVDDLTPAPMAVLGDVRRWWGHSLGNAWMERPHLQGASGQVVCINRSYPGVEVRRKYEFDLDHRREKWVNVEDRVCFVEDADRPHVLRQRFYLGFGLRPKVRKRRGAARVETEGVRADFEFEASRRFTLHAEPVALARRAATVFGLGEPYVLVVSAAGVTGRGPHFFRCRITWE